MNLLSSRYFYDGKYHPHNQLNNIQIAIKQQVDRKVAEGYYSFENTSCCICGKNDFDLIAQKDRYGLYMPVVVCKVCGLIQTNPRMAQESYNEFYNLEYRKLYTGQDKPNLNSFLDQYYRGKSIYNYLNPLFTLPTNEYFILEVGCGAGGVCYAFHEKGFRVNGIDVGEEYLNFGRKEYGLNLEVGTIEDIELEVKPNVIIYSHVFEHVLNPLKELYLIKKKLAPNGILFIEVPGVKNIEQAYEGDFLLLLQNAHTYHFTLLTLTNLLKIHGFKCLSGNEYIRAVFTPYSVTETQLVMTNDFYNVMSFLTYMENKIVNRK